LAPGRYAVCLGRVKDGYLRRRDNAVKACAINLAMELVNLRVDVILTSGSEAVRAAKQATRAIPIVMATVGYLDKLGLVESRESLQTCQFHNLSTHAW
jgi:ABC-type uncharacterized transport system substrate-binding protein